MEFCRIQIGHYAAHVAAAISPIDRLSTRALASACLNHDGYRVSTEQKDRFHVHRHHLVPLLLGGLQHRRPPHHTSVVGQDVETTHFINGPLHGTPAIGRQADIAPDRDGSAAGLGDGAGDGLTSPHTIEIDDGKCRPLPGKLQGDSPADARSGARNQCHLASQTLGPVRPPPMGASVNPTDALFVMPGDHSDVPGKHFVQRWVPAVHLERPATE